MILPIVRLLVRHSEFHYCFKGPPGRGVGSSFNYTVDKRRNLEGETYYGTAHAGMGSFRWLVKEGVYSFKGENGQCD